MARTQYTFTFTNAQPGSVVSFDNIDTDHLFAAATGSAKLGHPLVLNAQNAISVWSDAAQLTATTEDGVGNNISATATVANPNVTTADGTAGQNPFGSGTSLLEDPPYALCSFTPGLAGTPETLHVADQHGDSFCTLSGDGLTVTFDVACVLDVWVELNVALSSAADGWVGVFFPAMGSTWFYNETNTEFIAQVSPSALSGAQICPVFTLPKQKFVAGDTFQISTSVQLAAGSVTQFGNCHLNLIRVA